MKKLAEKYPVEFVQRTSRRVEFESVFACRMCCASTLRLVMSLGHQALTGVFPRTVTERVTVGPLELVLCESCGLLQLRHNYNPEDLYGMNYGYRSGLNGSMVQHLNQKVLQLEAQFGVRSGDVVLDIGSNDSTLLRSYLTDGLTRIGMDPSGEKFRGFYPADITLVSEIFTAGSFFEASGNRRAKLITSIAMFYDLQNPLEFVRDIAAALADDGLWHFEQSYLPSMIEATAYDTICHEHLEYYGLKQVKWMLDRCDLVAVDVETNSVNGGSFAVTAAKKNGKWAPNVAPSVQQLLQGEETLGLQQAEGLLEFEQKTVNHRQDLVRLIRSLKEQGKRVLGYGASTKGNVILQYCGFSIHDISCIAEVNADKFGSFTPGTGIPIVSEAEARAMNPDYFLVLPWHFRDSIIEREESFLASGGKLIFPLPEIQIVG